MLTMKNFHKYYLASLILPCTLVAMQREQKTCRHTILPATITAEFAEAAGSRKLKLHNHHLWGCEFHLFDGQCKSIATRIEALSELESVTLRSFLDILPHEGLGRVVKALVNLPRLRKLEINYTNLDDLDNEELELIIHLLRMSSHVSSLTLAACRLHLLTKNELGELADTLTKNKLTELNLSRNNLYQLRNTRLKQLTNALKLIRPLTHLNLSSNSLHFVQPSDWRLWGNAFRNLKKLDLRDNELGLHFSETANPYEFWDTLGQTLILSDIEHLDLSENKLCALNNPELKQVWEIIANMITHMKKLKSINVCKNGFMLPAELPFINTLADGLMRNPNNPTVIADSFSLWGKVAQQKQINIVFRTPQAQRHTVIARPIDTFFDSTYDECESS